MKKFFKQNGLFLVATLGLFMLTLMIATVNQGYTISDFVHNKYAAIMLIVLLFGAVYSFLFFKNIDKKEIDFAKVFLIIAIPISLLYCIANPMGKIPDERGHLLRSYEISKGNFITDKNELGYGVGEFNKTLGDVTSNDTTEYNEFFARLAKGDTDEVQVYQYSNVAVYSPFCYIPQVIILILTRIFGFSFIAQAYAARLANMIVAIIITYLAIKKFPLKKSVALIIALLPIVFNQMSSISPDALINSLTLFFLSYILQLKYDKDKKLENKDFAILSIVTLILAMCKIVYLPLVFMLLLIPADKFKSKKEKYIKLISVIVAVTILNLVWLGLAFGYTVEHSNEGVNSKEQVKFVLMHPWTYCVTLIRTLNINFKLYVLGLIGEGLGCLNIGSSSIFEYSLLAVLIVSFLFNENKEIKLDLVSRLITIFVVGCVILLTFTSLYVQWTTVGDLTVDGIQARYFVPILYLISLALQNSTFVINKKMNYRYLLLFMFFVNLHSITCIMSIYS